ncbi:choice-of-anchor J domain-containing protein [Prevotella sp. OH937_COT-195]|uniref:choice-of-anchor J domain-containing protein n=1 Tax=Prevotella sp. OH937_COT-195 TaxID=2491051 RepID=UPI000F64CC34|nr:choice-of-anchor J domain-containing protein [Prevotella sp. OH937_COT-195]RRD02762.1 hypothetical protein EII32_01775 [Prevotella sp. OH937_COT-195]
MSKKLTSLMVIAAAGLLSFPVCAQDLVAEKAILKGRNTIKSTERLNFGNMSKENILIKAIESGRADKTELEKIWNDNIGTSAVRNNFKKAAKVDELPYINDISTEEKFGELTVIDANNDSKTWEYYVSQKCAAYKYHSTNQGDDWLITPGIKLVAGKSYNFSVELAAGLASFPESFEIKMVKADDTPTANALNGGTEIVTKKTIENNKYTAYGKEGIVVQEEGYYYFGIHAVTDPDKFYLYAKNINITVGTITEESPAAPTIEVTPAAEGKLEAGVKVIAPTKNVKGDDLGDNISKIEVFRDNVKVKTFSPVTKGQELNFDDKDGMTHATHKYYAIPYDKEGEPGVKSDFVEVYVGSDIPKLPNEMTATDMSNKIGFKWDLVNSGVQGGYVNPAEIEYDVYTLVIKELWGYQYLDLDELLATVKNKDSYEHADATLDEGDQGFKFFGVQTKNAAGTNKSFVSSDILVGKPYELPLFEGLKDRKFHYVWYSDGVVSGLYISEDATDGDGVALDFRMRDGAQPGQGYLSTGKLNLNPAAHPTLLFDAKRGNANSNLAIYGSKDGAEPEKITDVELKDEYEKIKVDLSSLKGSRYAQLRFVSNFAAPTDNVIIDNIMVRDFYSDDLGIEMTAPEIVKAGEKATVVVTVENNGENTCNSYTVDFYAGERKIKTENVTEALKMFEKKQFNFEYETTIFDEPGDVTLKAVVTSEGDLKDENNTTQSIITVKQSTAAAPTDLNGTEADGVVTLTWKAPVNTTTEVTEDFESYAIWIYENIGEWTLIDGDKGLTGGFFQGTMYPSQGNPFAYTVWAPRDYKGDGQLDITQANTAMIPHSGDKALASIYSYIVPEDNPQGEFIPNDDWLISPELPGVAQTINFYVSHYTTNDGTQKFPQTYQVLYSETGKEVANFTAIGGDRKTAGGWENISVDLPDGTKYFAIRNISNKDDAFIFLLDDITFSKGGGEIASYNIYVDGELYTSVNGNVLTAVIKNLENASHKFAVSAVYSNGQESKPVTFILVTTSIENISVDGKPVDIYTIDGKLVRKQATSLEGLNGLYIINNQKVIIK